MKKLLAALLLFITFLGHGQIAKDKCKFLGNIYQRNRNQDDFTTYWNQVTPENAGKWGSTESTRDVMNWTNLREAYELAETNGFLFKQHTLVWGSQRPEWLEEIPQQEQYEEIEEWIKLYGEEFPDTYMIDVVNEPLHATEVVSTALGGSGQTGWDWVITAFEMAREYIPNAKLIINDYNIINNSNSVSQYKKIIELLQDRDLIDGIGLQSHYFSLENTQVSTLKNNLDLLAETGLPIYITELEIESTDDDEQLEEMKRIFPVLWEHPAVYGVTLWGYREGTMWRPDGYLIRTDGSERPAMTWLKNYVSNNSGGYFCYDVLDAPEKVNPQLKLFPNPISDGKVRIEHVNGIQKIELFNLSGQLVKDFNLNGDQSTSLNLRLKSGIYQLKVQTADGNFITEKIIIQ